MGTKKVSIIIPAYNEEESILETIIEIKKAMNAINKCSYEIIAVDDGSEDDTKIFLEKARGVKIISHKMNQGYGKSLKDAIEAAKNEIIVMLDADGTYPPDEIPSLLKYSDEYDMVSGMRDKSDMPLIRRPAKFMLSKLANFMAGQKIPDINCGLRVIKKSNAKKFFGILPQRFSFTITHLLACLTNGYSVKFVPIKYNKRKGKSTIHPVKDFIRFLTIIMRVITYFNPLKTFSLLSIMLLLLAAFVFLLSCFVFNKIMDTTIIILIIASLQIFLMGLIADLIIKNNKIN